MEIKTPDSQAGLKLEVAIAIAAGTGGAVARCRQGTFVSRVIKVSSTKFQDTVSVEGEYRVPAGRELA